MKTIIKIMVLIVLSLLNQGIEKVRQGFNHIANILSETVFKIFVGKAHFLSLSRKVSDIAISVLIASMWKRKKLILYGYNYIVSDYDIYPWGKNGGRTHGNRGP